MRCPSDGAAAGAARLTALQRAGFYVHHIKGSHHFLKHPDRPDLRVTVPVHNDDLKRVSAIRHHHRPERAENSLAHLLYVAEYLTGAEEDLPSALRLESSLSGIGLE